MINGTHEGQDLFSPYAKGTFEMKLDGGAWGAQLAHRHVYGWRDFYVIERDGQVVACGGLWDRGRDIRERWRNPTTGEERTISATALMDFGFEPGHEADMAALIRHFIGETATLGRDYLVAPLQQLPSVAELLADCDPQLETRALGWFLWDEYGRDVSPPDPMVERPYTDLAYW